jgi:hypothetical protein
MKHFNRLEHVHWPGMPAQAGATMSAVHKRCADRPIFTIRLRPEPGIDGIRSLRRLLKFALRGCGLRAVSVEETRR